MFTLDERVNFIKETFKNNKNWFGKEIPSEQISDMYKRTSIPTKKDNKPKYSFKIPIVKDKIQCQLYDKNKISLEFFHNFLNFKQLFFSIFFYFFEQTDYMPP